MVDGACKISSINQSIMPLPNSGPLQPDVRWQLVQDERGQKYAVGLPADAQVLQAPDPRHDLVMKLPQMDRCETVP